MQRKVLAILAGLIVGIFAVAAIEKISGTLYPPPRGLDPADTAALRQHIESLPTTAFVLVLLAHALGSFGSTFVCALIEKSKFVIGTWILGGTFLFFGILNLILIPHPFWFEVMDALLYLPMALLGGISGYAVGQGLRSNDPKQEIAGQDPD